MNKLLYILSILFLFSCNDTGKRADIGRNEIIGDVKFFKRLDFKKGYEQGYLDAIEDMNNNRIAMSWKEIQKKDSIASDNYCKIKS